MSLLLRNCFHITSTPGQLLLWDMHEGCYFLSPVKQAFLHNSIPSEQRASLASFDSMFGNGGGALQQVGLGYLSRVGSIANGYVVGGAFTLVAQIFLWRLRGLRSETDIIVGRRAGVQGSCPAQGLPDVALVDTRQTA